MGLYIIKYHDFYKKNKYWTPSVIKADAILDANGNTMLAVLP